MKYIGHSNTTPIIVRKLGVADYPSDEIRGNEFDHLFLIRFKKGKAILTKAKYGAPSSTSATMK